MLPLFLGAKACSQLITDVISQHSCMGNDVIRSTWCSLLEFSTVSARSTLGLLVMNLWHAHVMWATVTSHHSCAAELNGGGEQGCKQRASSGGMAVKIQKV